MARAADDSANLGSSTSGGSIAVSGRPCPCSVWSSTATPEVAAVASGRATEVGVRFRPMVDGRITGLRFYKGPGNTGTHTGSLWTTTGQRLGTLTFGGETATGWQTAAFGSPIAVSAGVVYVASYHTDTGHYAADEWFFATAGVRSWPLELLADWTAGGNNGLFRTGRSRFPNRTSRSTNYWVDVVFQPTG
jgi:hypothetical protein